jgi:putative chitinase
MITSQLKLKIPAKVLDELPEVIDTFKIDSVNKLTHLLAQCAHESGNFKFVEENLNYSADGLLKIFPKYFSKDTAAIAARKPEVIANMVYSNRMGNGDRSSGDGWKFRGRGYVMLTGKGNYKAFGEYIGVDLVANPDLVATKYPLTVAGWYFETKRLWQIADRGIDEETIKIITRRVNGAYIGLADRISKTKVFNSFLV